MSANHGNLQKFLDRTLHWHSRIKAGQGLEKYATDTAIEAIVNLLYDSSDIYDVREVAARILAKTPNPAGVEALLQAITNRNLPEETRRCAMTGLYQNLPEKFQNLLLEIADDDSEEQAVRRMAMTILNSKRVEAVVPILIRLIDAPFMRQGGMRGRNTAVYMLMNWDTAETKSAILRWLHRALQDESLDLEVREWAVQDMRTLADPRSEDVLIAMIDSDAVQGRRLSAGKSKNHAVEALRAIGSEKALQAVAVWEQNHPEAIADSTQKDNPPPVTPTPKAKPPALPKKKTNLEMEISRDLFGKRIVLETDLSLQEIADRLEASMNRSVTPFHIAELYQDDEPPNLYLRAFPEPGQKTQKNATRSQRYTMLEGYFSELPDGKRTMGDLRYSVPGVYTLLFVIMNIIVSLVTIFLILKDQNALGAFAMIIVVVGGLALIYAVMIVSRGFRDGDRMVAFIRAVLT